MCGGRVRLLQLAHTGAGLAENFVAHHLHGLSEVKREIGRIAADSEQAVAALYFVDVQAEGFVAEYEGYLKILPRGLQQLGHELARGVQRGREFAAAAGEGAAQYGVGQRFIQGGHNLCLFQHVARAGSEDKAFFRQLERGSLGGIEGGWLGGHRRGHQVGCHQGEAAQAHGFHGAGSGTDVAGMAGAGEHHVDVAQVVGNGGGICHINWFQRRLKHGFFASGIGWLGWKSCTGND